MNGNRTIRQAPEVARGLMLLVLLGLAGAAWGQAKGKGAGVAAPADPKSIEDAIGAARGTANDQARQVALRPLAASVEGRIALLKLMSDSKEAMRHAAMTVMAYDYQENGKALRDDAYKNVLPAALEQLVEEVCMPRDNPFNPPVDLLRQKIGPGADMTPGIIKNLVSDDAKRRLSASNLLELGPHSTEMREAVVKALGDGNRDVRSNAGKWLMKDGAAGRAALLAAIKSPNAAVRVTAVACLDDGSRQLSAEMITVMGDLMMHDPDRQVRNQAADRLRSQRSKEAIAMFIEAIRNGSEEVRRVAADQIGGRGEAAVALLPLLDDKNSAVRIAALRALSNNERREYMPLDKVVRLLDDSDLEISKAAAVALQEWNQRGPVSARRIGSLRAVSDRRGMRTEYDRDLPVEPPAPPWRTPDIKSDASTTVPMDAAGGSAATASMMLTALAAVLLGTFGILAVVRRAGLLQLSKP